MVSLYFVVLVEEIVVDTPLKRSLATMKPITIATTIVTIEPIIATFTVIKNRIARANIVIIETEFQKTPPLFLTI
jgi:hypothetical protein